MCEKDRNFIILAVGRIPALSVAVDSTISGVKSSSSLLRYRSDASGPNDSVYTTVEARLCASMTA